MAGDKRLIMVSDLLHALYMVVEREIRKGEGNPTPIIGIKLETGDADREPPPCARCQYGFKYPDGWGPGEWQAYGGGECNDCKFSTPETKTTYNNFKQRQQEKP